ncbi:hypothetical protein QEV83_11995 [Methylocapsa sp. D3K7]|uniref:hypothetical protein n=1 Tax=Methylocapsa sp. D3K7 TaxID=3041435 RepID=UPI00244EE1DC|nr:hypothetical protein [Methylocapsa sp. D3K7]WGJ13420.1 hypothetical protein QEV83_11995 [Methylocapsa sp. D3K7]
MFTRRSTKTVIALSVIAVPMTAVSLPVWAGEGGAIAAGVAGGVAGTMAGQVLSGALPPQNYYGSGYPPQPQPQCHYEHRQEFSPYSFHIGGVQVCD